MDTILNFVLTLSLVYGYPIIFLATVLVYFGLPIPISAIIMASGAFASSDTLDIKLLIPIVFFVSFFGDVVHYYLARKYGVKVSNLISPRYRKFLHKDTHNYLKKWGPLVVFTSRWLVTPLGIPINIIAGINHYPPKSFLFWSALGEMFWSFGYITLGNFFGSNWIYIFDYIDDVPTLLSLVFVGVILLTTGLKIRKNRQLRSASKPS